MEGSASLGQTFTKKSARRTSSARPLRGGLPKVQERRRILQPQHEFHGHRAQPVGIDAPQVADVDHGFQPLDGCRGRRLYDAGLQALPGRIEKEILTRPLARRRAAQGRVLDRSLSMRSSPPAASARASVPAAIDRG
jgi:hypothetical protein